MEFRLLGPLEVRERGTPVSLGSSKQRALLALLLLNRNRVVSRERLIDDLWGDDFPASATKMVQIHVSGLRKVLPPGLLVTQGSGYSLEVDDPSVDLAQFERLAADGRAALAAGDPATAAAVLGEALALWRGAALVEFSEPFARSEGTRLEELRMAALEDRIESDLRCGRHAELVAETDALVASHPLRERLRGQLMLALYRSGRQADALATYRGASRVLGEELGLNPSAMLRDLERRILLQDPTLFEHVAPAAPPAPQPPAPALAPHPASSTSLSERPATRYVTRNGVSIAFQVFGDGPLELALVTGWVLPIEVLWDEPTSARFLERLGSFARVVIWDKRGTGMSDRLPPGEAPPLDDRMGDLLAVIDAAGFSRPAVFGISEGTALSVLLATTHPERVRALAIYGGWAMTMRAADHPWAPAPDEVERFIRWSRDHWSDPGNLVGEWAPTRSDDEAFKDWWGRAMRVGASPTTADRWLRLSVELDIRDVLSAIEVSTLVVHRTGDRIIPVQSGRYLAEHIVDARYVELPGEDHLWWVGEQDELLDAVESFLTGSSSPRVPERLLTTVLFTDIVDSTRLATTLGDADWRELLERHDRVVRAELARFAGREIKTTGDGFLACFDGPTRAIRCALAIREAVSALHIEIRTGLHTGEVEQVGTDITGIAVNLGARIGAAAHPGEILVSRTVTDLVAGSGIVFHDRGDHQLEGFERRFSLLAVASV